MTEASENGWLVRVRAQVMSRDEATGGWVALGGGGLAHVMVGRRRARPPPPPPPPPPTATATAPAKPGPSASESNGDTTSSSTTAPTHEYFIHGRRISDNMVVLECTIQKDFQYNKVMPTFHHWVTDEKRFGLTFQTAADARAFDKGVRTAIEELLHENKLDVLLDTESYETMLGLGGAWPSLHAYNKLNIEPNEDDEEQNIFECLNLPSDSRSSSENSTGSRARRRNDGLSQTPILSAITLPSHHDPLKSYEVYDDKVEDSDGDRCPYVHLSAVHEYVYPQVGAPTGLISAEKGSPLAKDTDSLKKHTTYSTGPPPLPDKKPTETFAPRLRCRYCHEWYLESANRRGACAAAPDCARACIDCVSCLKCAQCMLYHCMSREDQDDYVMHPCACTPRDHNCVKRWIGLTLLSIAVPCLWCYLPLRCAHRAMRRAELAGGAHRPRTEQPRRQ